MARRFWDVLPMLSVSDDLKELLDHVTIDKVVSSRDRSSLRIYMICERLVPKRYIYKLEANIKKQFFPDRRIDIKIIEKFRLSSLYTPEVILDKYADSIELELKMYSLVVFNIYSKAKVEFSEGVMSVRFDDDIVARSRAEEIKEYLEKVFNDRCGLNTEVRYTFNGHGHSYIEENELMMSRQAANVVSASSLNRQSGKDADKTVPLSSDKPKKKYQKEDSDIKSPDKNKSWDGKTQRKKYVHHDDVIFGRDFDDDEITKIENITQEMGEVIVCAKVLSFEEKVIKSGSSIFIFNVTDFTDTITVKMFVNPEDTDTAREAVKEGSFIKLKGITTIDRFDGELTISSVRGIRKAADFTVRRMDNSPKKRVELHCHTKMSDMDGVTDVKDIIKRAKSWGHEAIAITDHGCVQAFPDAAHALDKNDEFKMIYGVEGYLVDDLKDIAIRSEGQSLKSRFVVFDIETTGLSSVKNKIIEIGAVKIEDGRITDRFSVFVNPGEPIPYNIEKLTGINDAMVLDADPIEKVLPEFIEFSKDAVMVAHNADFDMGFMEHNAGLMGIDFSPSYVDTVGLARVLIPELSKYKLDNVAKALGVSLENHHRAVDDAEATAHIFLKLAGKLENMKITNLDEINSLSAMEKDSVKKMPTYHIIILAKNEIGRINLYHLISLSHIEYYAGRPRIPKSVLQKYRDGLIIGSACEAGELFQAVIREASDADIARIVKFYDYLEIQPVGNNQFMIDSDRYAYNSIEDLRNLNRRIVSLGEHFKKPVVATCDVHFLDPEDEVYRRIIMAGMGFKDADRQPPLYLRTTEEMLSEFEYLGSAKAQEVVITNSNLIADMCDRISPVRPDKCPPVIENSDKDLRDMCYKRAHEIYGDVLPVQVTSRLERELDSIISNGFAVMYIIAQKLVSKSMSDGYLVGSRGSVGSSFVATMSGITEVNPLSPHYYCSKCHYYDFESEDVKKFAGGAGCDMPDKICPQCGEKLHKNGFDIPFETFLGFEGNKEPDIDLNFSGEYQAKAHAYTEVIFGKGHTFKAGTIGTLADKTAFGFVKNYYEERGIRKRNCEISRIVSGCVGVRRTTGQHPGGIVVLPHGEKIYSFTPVQRPANDVKSNITTTHFDYHKIDHNLLKLDILGHDDPTMIKRLGELTGIDMINIPFDSKEVMSLFKDTSALGITPDDIGGCKLGALGIPEFGTDFAMQMLIDAKPQCFSDLVRIAGLSHGTDVWLGNAQTLILSGTATIQTAICTRDDIMLYLISKGMDKGLSFNIMEKVRKGKGLKPEWEEEMLKHDVPQWYVDSCKKIKYMFPKAHAAAYVMMAWRIAYCKVFYPLAYYTAYFSIRATGFSYELMCRGRDKLEYYLADYKKRKDTLSNKEQDTYKDMRIVQEMYARGFEFMPIDIYRAKADRFQIIDGKIMPSLVSIEGMGIKNAEGVEKAASGGKYLSVEDFMQRTKVGKSTTDLMCDLGLLGNLPQSNQMSIFDIDFLTVE